MTPTLVRPLPKGMTRYEPLQKVAASNMQPPHDPVREPVVAKHDQWHYVLSIKAEAIEERRTSPRRFA
jgi:hypothetical protein